MTLSARISRHAAIAATGILALGFICFAVGLRVNTTRSIPVGLYWMTARHSQHCLMRPRQEGTLAQVSARGITDT